MKNQDNNSQKPSTSSPERNETTVGGFSATGSSFKGEVEISMKGKTTINTPLPQTGYLNVGAFDAESTTFDEKVEFEREGDITFSNQPQSESEKLLREKLKLFEKQQAELDAKLNKLSNDIVNSENDELVTSLQTTQRGLAKQKRILKEGIQLIQNSAKSNFKLDSAQNTRLTTIEQLNLFSNKTALAESAQHFGQTNAKTTKLVYLIEEK
jgi:hypothetical protein